MVDRALVRGLPVVLDDVQDLTETIERCAGAAYRLDDAAGEANDRGDDGLCRHYART